MVESHKFVLMIQPPSRQGMIWQAILRSQQIAVLWESADVDLIDSLNHLKLAGKPLPDMLLIDTRLLRLNAYAIARWCHHQYPEMSVVLFNGAQTEVTDTEREWAIYQGAADLLPRFRWSHLLSDTMEGAKRILELLHISRLDSTALVFALFRVSKSHGQPEHSPVRTAAESKVGSVH